MKTARLLHLVLILVALVSAAPVSSGQAQLLVGGVIRMSGRALNFIKGFMKGMEWYDTSKTAGELFQKLGVVSSMNDTSAPSILKDMYESKFHIQFSVGNPPQPVTALLGISSEVTYINSANLINSQASLQCCSFQGSQLVCGPAYCQRNNQGYTFVMGNFAFNSAINSQSYFLVSGTSVNPEGVISFSRSPYSILQSFQKRRFSYFFSLNSQNDSTISLGEDAPSDVSGLQSTPLVTNQGYYSYLYFVSLAQIFVGSNSVQIEPQRDLPYGVILDTIIPAILLANPAYTKVSNTIRSKMGTPVSGTNGFELCYSNSPSWPDLKLSFSGNSGGGAADMVLKKENYVIKNSDNLECAAILPTVANGFSVIGTMAQLDRQMILDHDQQMLYFDKYPDDGSSTPGDASSNSNPGPFFNAKPTIALNMLAVFYILVLLC